MHFRPTDNKNRRALWASTTSESALCQGGKSFYLSPSSLPHNTEHFWNSSIVYPQLKYGTAEETYLFLYLQRKVFNTNAQQDRMLVNKQWQVVKADGFEKICGSPWLHHPRSSTGYWQKWFSFPFLSLLSSWSHWLPQRQERTGQTHSCSSSHLQTVLASL